MFLCSYICYLEVCVGLPLSHGFLSVGLLTFQERKEQQQKREGVGGFGVETVKQRRFRVYNYYV